MKNRIFKLYQAKDSKLESSFFDLISGDKETKQTKGLAYLFKACPQLLVHFLKFPLILARVKEATAGALAELLACDLVQIDAEMLSTDKTIRRDITISFFAKNVKQLVIVLEAKSVKTGNTGQIEEQLRNYFDPKHFPDKAEVPRIGITLTKYNQLFENQDSRFISITWTDIVSILEKTIQTMRKAGESTELIGQYLTFITEVDKGMKFYEKEILAIPAGSTYELIKKHHIHACPVSYPYKSALFVTFRNKGGGVMERLYKVEEIVVLNPTSPSYESLLEKSEIPWKDKLLAYIKDRKQEWRFSKVGQDYRFYLLSEKEQIDLVHKPRLEKNSNGHCYFTLAELLKGKEIVQVDGK